MSSERSRIRHQRHEHQGANIAPALSIGAVFDIASQLRSKCAAFLRITAVSPSVVVPSLGAQLRISPHQKVMRISAERALPRSGVAVLSEASSSRSSASVQISPLPNNALVPTRKSEALLLAAQRGR